MDQLQKQINELHKQVVAACDKLDIAGKNQLASELEAELALPGAWDDSEAAQAKSRELANLRQAIDPWTSLQAQLGELVELAAMNDVAMSDELEAQLHEIAQQFNKQKKDLQMNGPYDGHGAILRLSAGAGGTDAQDWTECLERMYLRWAEKAGYKTDIVERSAGEEAGVKTSVIEINGAYAYGKLRGEHGVHRLVRLSPFNSDNLRQTSFALVEVLPQIDAPSELAIDETDLKIDVYRAGGKGGQSVNTTDSAVRVTHLPTGITVAIQNERSQLQNKDTAMKLLRSKLAQLQLEQHQDDIAKLKGPAQSAEWGSQIRNYVLHPYTMVKDTRTGRVDRDAAGVLDGKLDGFIEAFLEH